MNNSTLFDEKTFYKQFISDLKNCKKEVIIESPFITSGRMKMLYPILADLAGKRVKISIITRNPLKHTGIYTLESELEIQLLNILGFRFYFVMEIIIENWQWLMEESYGKVASIFYPKLKAERSWEGSIVKNLQKKWLCFLNSIGFYESN